MPWPSNSRMAGIPSVVPGTLIMMFSRNCFPEAHSFVDGFSSLMREMRRDFEAHVAIAALGFIVDAAQDIGCIPNVANGDLFVDPFRVEVLVLSEFLQCESIIGAMSNGFLENCGIRGHSAEAVFFNQAIEFPGRDEIAADVIEPDGLAETKESLQRVFALAG